MTQKQKADAFAGKTADLLLENGLRVGVKTIRGQARYGRIDVLVEPLEGSGQAWVGAGKVKVRKEAKLESEWDKPSLITPFHAYVESSGYVDGHGFCGICGCTESYAKHAPQPAEEPVTPSPAEPLPIAEVTP